MSSKEVIQLIEKGTVEIFQKEQLLQKLAKNQPLKIKAGYDPTAPDLHLGHSVLLEKLKLFQSLGHEVLFLIGDYTAQIGDPTGKNAQRQMLTREQVLENAKTYEAQVFKVLDPKKTTIVFNSTWLNALTSAELIGWTRHFTVAQMLARDDFSKRYASETPIAISEFLYPLLQGYDSVALKSDIELGGTDQTFNLLMGREMQRLAGQEPQVVITLPLLEGTDGVQKMSKSLGNTIALQDSPKDFFGKLMSISDTLMWRYYSILSHETSFEVEQRQARIAAGENPRDHKLDLAQELTTRLFSAEEGAGQRQAFLDQYQKKGLPDDISTLVLETKTPAALSWILKQVGLVASTTEGIRLLKQGAIKLDNTKVEDHNHQLVEGQYLVQVGKHKFAHIHVKKEG